MNKQYNFLLFFNNISFFVIDKMKNVDKIVLKIILFKYFMTGVLTIKYSKDIISFVFRGHNCTTEIFLNNEFQEILVKKITVH